MVLQLEECLVCSDRRASIVFHPCGHICACENCAVLMKKCVTCRSHIDRMSSLLVSCSKNQIKSSNLVSLPSPPSNNSTPANNNAVFGAGAATSSALGPGANVISNNTSTSNNSNVTAAGVAPSNLSPSMEANLLSSHSGSSPSTSVTGDNIQHANNTGLSGAYGQQFLNNGSKDYAVQKLQQQLQDIKEQVNRLRRFTNVFV